MHDLSDKIIIDEELEEWDIDLPSETTQDLALGLAWRDRQFPIHSRIEEKDIGSIVGEFFIVGMKTEGVEPGFLAVRIDEKFLHRFNHDEEIKNYFTKNLPISDLNALIEFLKTQYEPKKDDLTIFAKKLCAEGMGIKECRDVLKLNLWLFKGDYGKNIDDDKVVPPKKNLQNSTAIQSYPPLSQSVALFFYQQSRKTQREVQNFYNLLEIIASDIARCSGMKTHEIYWVPSLYPDKTLQFMMASKYEPKMRTFKGRLAGSQPGKYENYLIKISEEPTEGKSVVLRADRNIFTFTIFLTGFISGGNSDEVGGLGQNKGTIGDKFFCFDLGHAHREKNAFIKTLTPDFFFKELYGKCKNFSLFYDAPLSQMYKGMFLILKTLKQETIKEIFTSEEIRKVKQAIKSYKMEDKEFKRMWQAVPWGALDSIFSKYIMAFTTLSEKSEEKTREEYSFYARRIGESHKFAREARIGMLQVCKEYMQLTSMEVDFLDNLRKLTSVTKTRSSNNKVLLNHLRVLPEERILWKMHKNTSENKITVTAIIEESRIKDRLIKYLKIKHIDIEVDISGCLVQLIFPLEKMSYIAACFCEENIRKFKHPESSILNNKKTFIPNRTNDNDEKEKEEHESTREVDQECELPPLVDGNQFLTAEECDAFATHNNRENSSSFGFFKTTSSKQSGGDEEYESSEESSDDETKKGLYM